MIGLTSEITDDVSFGRKDHHLHLCSQLKQVWLSALLKGTSRIRTHFSDYESDTLATYPYKPSGHLKFVYSVLCWTLQRLRRANLGTVICGDYQHILLRCSLNTVVSVFLTTQLPENIGGKMIDS